MAEIFSTGAFGLVGPAVSGLSGAAAALASVASANPVVATMLAASTAKSLINSTVDLVTQKTPKRPSDTTTIMITANENNKAWIDMDSIRDCCVGVDDHRNYQNLKIADEYASFLTLEDFIVLCELPVSLSKIQGNQLLVDEKVYELKVGARKVVVKYTRDILKNVGSSDNKIINYFYNSDGSRGGVSVTGISSVRRISEVLKISTVNPAVTVVVNYQGIMGKKIPKNNIYIVVFIKHLLRNMAVVYGDDKRENLQPEVINTATKFSREEQFSLPPQNIRSRPDAPVPVAPAVIDQPQLFIFRNNLLSFWKGVGQNDTTYYLHFQVLLNRASKVFRIDVSFHEDNSLQTLELVRKKWIFETFNAENAPLATQGIWKDLSKEASSQSSSLTDYKEEYQKVGSNLLDKAVEVYKNALESDNPEEIRIAKNELRKVENSLLLDSLKSDGDASLRQNMYRKLVDLDRNGELLERNVRRGVGRRNDELLGRNVDRGVERRNDELLGRNVDRGVERRNDELFEPYVRDFGRRYGPFAINNYGGKSPGKKSTKKRSKGTKQEKAKKTKRY